VESSISKTWQINANYSTETSQHLREVLGTDRIISLLLAQRGIENYQQAKDFFRPDLSLLHDPFLMKGMEQAVDRINSALEENQRILIFGDYDVDGTTAVALFYSFIKELTSNVEFYIPDRYAEGYGISYQGIDYAAEKKCALIVSLDCGIKSTAKVKYAKEKGIDFIICDHHLPGDELPEAFAILDPKQSDCAYPYKELPGCAIGFKLAQAICTANNIDAASLEQYLDLVAISIAADIVPITGENRVLAHFGLKILNQMNRPGIKALLENVKVEKDLTISNVVFIIGPRINAAGRIDHGSKAVRLLIATDFDEAKKIASEINLNNLERRDLDTGITQEALQMVGENELLKKKKSTVLYNEKWHKGVVGIVASRMTEHYYRPTIILTESNGKVVGSARSVKDFDVYQAIENCSELLEQFGGHKYAAGLTMSKDNLPGFSEKFEKVVAASISEEMLIPKEEIDIEINFNEVNDKLVRILSQFSPHGPGNMTPVFCTYGVFDTGYAKVVGNNHLKLELYQENNFGVKIPAIGFGLGDFLSFFQKKRPVGISYVINENNFQNVKKLQLVVRSIKID
jgi:single-stranded-DNA-specific exonuclease